MHMRVTQTVQSPGNDPVTFPLYTGDDPMGVVSALASAMAMREDLENNPPFPVRTLALHVEF